MVLTAREFLDNAVLTRSQVDRFLDPTRPNWATFDPELGYVLRDCLLQDGVDGCYTVARYQTTGERRMVNFTDRPCRINTYGDSFTQCHQVSDGETWEEYLAAHLGEPIRNFGVGGYGVYQSYRRMLRQEATPSAAPYVILGIYDDDHVRNLDAWRWLRAADFRRSFRQSDGRMFHCNPWAYVRIDPDTGEMEERANPYPTPESLYLLCDREHVYEAFTDDLVVKVLLAQQGGPIENLTEIRRLAEVLGLTPDMVSPEGRLRTVQAVYDGCAQRSTLKIVEMARAYADRQGKQLLVVLFYRQQSLISACQGHPRPDQDLVDLLRVRAIPFVDVREKHLEEYRSFRLSPEEYARRYLMGHYNPRGNHFVAFAMKDAIVDWLQPRPPTYGPAG